MTVEFGNIDGDTRPGAQQKREAAWNNFRGDIQRAEEKPLANIWEKFKALARRLTGRSEFPRVMRTMSFWEPITVPYTRTVYGINEGPLFYYAITRFKTPIVTVKSCRATEYNWYEARKINTANGPQYEIYGINNVVPNEVVPGLNCKKYEATRLSCEDDWTLFSKADALAKLCVADEIWSDLKRIERDAAHMPHHFSRYQAPKP